ncbi:MAG: hypothetical protein WCR51_10420 [Planctomycetia bacterium]
MNPGEPCSDALLDAALRAVEVPPDLGDRLRPERLFDERAIDRLLVDVAVPAGLSGRVRPLASVSPAAADGARSHPKDSRTPWPGARWQGWFRGLARDGMAVAVSLGFVVAMFCAGLWITDVVTRDTAVRQQARHTPARPVRRKSVSEARSATGRAVVKHEGDGHASEEAVDRSTRRVAEPQADAFVDLPSPRRDAPPVVRTAPLPLSDDLGRGAWGRSAPSSGMRVVPDGGVGDVRRAVPRMRGFDLAFEMAHGEPPFIDPSIAPGLAVDRPPLVVATDSFDRIWPLPPGRRRLAEVERLRVEHLFAALSSAEAASGTGVPLLGLSAVRSIRPGRPTYLVELRLAVPVARVDASWADAATDVTVVLDHSAGPEAVPLWLAACRGLAAAAARMGPDDRLTVIVAEPRPRRVAIRTTTPEIQRLCRELEEELPFGSADLDGAVALAEETAVSEGGGGRLVVVAHADRAERCDGAAGDALRRWRAAVAGGDEGAGSRPRFLLVSGVSDGADAEALAAVPGWTLSDPTIVRRRLADAIAGRPAFVAGDAALEVRFDPRAIAAYRLVGHRQGVPESLAAFGKPSVAASCDVHGGETVRVVYEVVPRREPVGQVAGVAATLSYREPSGAVRTLTASAAPVDPWVGMAPSAQGCELLLAVGIGECAGRSVHAVPQRLAIERLREVTAAWRRRGDVTVVGERLFGVLEDVATVGGAPPHH